ncbi:MAG TPA: sulfatase-like hydrolase/transferase, partial [Candidatus Paraprevotella stercorigallinarum]|nr:sulfatase-like hydrolase/transferase [Candidatus Paraprevotella stercorigallinarum]
MAGAAGMAMPVQAVQSKKIHPHIILIMTDQQRADALGCAGNDCVLTPNIDRLAAEGHRFCNA